jgi:hypothetical protein
MGYFLKSIGTTTNPCPQDYAVEYVDFPVKRRPSSIHEDDYLILYAVGGLQRIFVHARVISGITTSDYPEWPYRLRIEYLDRMFPANGVPIDEVNINRDLKKSLRQHSYIRLTSEEFERAVSLLNQQLG